MRPAEKNYEFQPLPKQENLNLLPLNAQGRFSEHNLAQVTQQRKCKHRKPQPRKGKEQDNDSPCDQGKNPIQ
jgi:hypothetical protein